MRKVIQALIIALIMALILPVVTASAVSCVVLEHQLPDLDTVVEGRITEILAKGRIRLQVTTYYKGAGGPILEAEVVGLDDGGRMDWGQVPRRGDRVLIGFVRQGQTLRNDLCHPLTVLPRNQGLPVHVRTLLGDGHPPEGDVDDRTGRTLGWVLPAGIVVMVGALAWLLTRKARKAKA